MKKILASVFVAVVRAGSGVTIILFGEPLPSGLMATLTSDSMPACSSGGSMTHEKTISEGGLITLYEPATMTFAAPGRW